MSISPLMRGDDKQGEPDYICGEDGYEVTFAISSSLIPQIKGVKALDGKKNNIAPFCLLWKLALKIDLVLRESFK